MSAPVDVLAVVKGDGAWFVCRAAGIVDDVTLPLRAAMTSEVEIAKRGRMRAAREFKRRHGLHPCTKVECEFQGVERDALRAVGGA